MDSRYNYEWNISNVHIPNAFSSHQYLYEPYRGPEEWTTHQETQDSLRIQARQTQ